MLEDNFDAMKGYVNYMQTWVDKEDIMHSKRTGKDGKILKWFNLGDWIAPGNLPPDEMVHTFFLWQCADITAKTAEILGFQKEAVAFSELTVKTKKAFQERFYNKNTGSYGKAGGNIFALKMGIPENQYANVVTALKNDIKENNGHLDTGIFGTQLFFEVLSENGMHDLAYEAMNKRDEPGYGRWIELGSTTTRENWNEGGSHNHPMFGGGLVWFYRKLAGMSIDANKPGYKNIIFKPMPAGDIHYARYSNQTSYGDCRNLVEKGKRAVFDANICSSRVRRHSLYTRSDR